MQRVVIVDPTESTRESLRAMLLGVDFVWLESECTRYEYFLNVVDEGTQPGGHGIPDLAIVSMDADKAKALQMIGQLSAKHPKLPILTISHDHQALLQSLQRGAKYFLTQPVGLEDLLAALRRALGEAGMEAAPGGGLQASGALGRAPAASQVIAVLGSRGGVGTTSLAVNLAATLACEPGHAVALLDLDLALGDADIAVELKGIDNISIADLARNIERLDMNFLRRALVKHEPTGLNVLRHPLDVADISVIHEGHIERVVNLLRISYSHLVLDLTKSLLPTDLMALRMADVVLLTAQLELSSLRNVVRLLHCLGGEDQIADKCRVVLNRVGSEAVEEGISVKKAEEVIGRKVYWEVPNDHKAMIAARVAGGPLVKVNPRSRAQQAIAALALDLSGKKAAGPDPRASASRGWFSRK